MQGWWNKMTTATTAAYQAFGDAWNDPLRATAPAFDSRQAYFSRLWEWYSSTSFEDAARWQSYRERRGLYRHIRTIYNPTRRLVNFYAGQVYPGVLTIDGAKLPDGVQVAIPFAEDTNPDLLAAVGQTWQWANWQTGNKLMVRNGGIAGSVLVEILDNVESGKVSYQPRWAGFVKDLVLDAQGNVKSYVLEYGTEDKDGSYLYRREVDGNEFRYFRDDKPFIPEGKSASVEPHPYGFVPAVWCKHLDEGGDYGAPAIAGSTGKLSELNSLVSHVHDDVDRQIEQIGIIASSSPVGLLGETAKRLVTEADEMSAGTTTTDKASRNTSRIIKGGADTKWQSMSSNFDTASAMPLIEKLIGEIETDHPELSMYAQLRTMSSVTGVAAARLMGDVYGRVLEVSANYDTQSVKLFQMAVAIGGFRYKENREGWRQRTRQQAKFAKFTLESYAKGELDLEILPRPLVPMTTLETIELQGARLKNANDAEGLFNEDLRLELAGIMNPERRAEILSARATSDPTMNVEQ